MERGGEREQAEFQLINSWNMFIPPGLKLGTDSGSWWVGRL